MKYILVLFIIFLTQARGESVWLSADVEQIGDASPLKGRVSYSMISYETEENGTTFVIFGGRNLINAATEITNNTFRYNDCWKFYINNQSQAVWQMITPYNQSDKAIPTGRELHSAVYVPPTAAGPWANTMVVYGGDVSDWLSFPRLISLNLENNTWNVMYNPEIKEDPFPGRLERIGHSAAYSSYDNTMIIFGGATVAEVYDDTWKFNLTSLTWKRVYSDINPPSAQAHGSAITSDGRYFYIVNGGKLPAFPVNGASLTALWRLDVQREQWQLMNNKAPITYQGCQMFMIENSNILTLWMIPYTRITNPVDYSPFVGNYSAFQFHIRSSETIEKITKKSWLVDDLIGTPPQFRTLYQSAMTPNLTLYDYAGQYWVANTPIPEPVNWLTTRQFRFVEEPESTNDVNGITTAKKSNTVAIAVGIAVPIVVLIALAIILAFIILQRRKANRNQQMMFEMDHDTKPVNISVECAIYDVTIQNSIGNGNFGQVYKGLWQSSAVACKKLKNNELWKDFEREASNLRSLSHPNIVQFFGIYVSSNGDKYIVTEYMTYGDLATVLATNKNILNIKQALEMCKDVAAGMQYISAKNMVHRDLALRNLLVTTKDGKYVVKVSDLGLGRSMNDQGFYNATQISIPVRWTAPEAIKFMRFSRESDVWSMGIVLWEILSLTAIPYGNMSNNEVVEQVERGYRLPIPTALPVPDNIYQLMLKCWSIEPQDRPSFFEIYETLSTEIEHTPL